MDRDWRTRIIADYSRSLVSIVITMIVTSGLAGVVLLWSATPVQAQAISPDNACRLCHVGMEDEWILPSGEVLPLDVDEHILNESIHGDQTTESIYCTDCHDNGDSYRYPHRPNPAETIDEFVDSVALGCEQCHPSSEEHNPGHLLSEETEDLPNCVDCHGGHDAFDAEQMKAGTVDICQQCHSEFENEAVGQIHEEIVANLSPDENCRTCHVDQPFPQADAQCRLCHEVLQSEYSLPSGDTIPLHVEQMEISDSVHGIGNAENDDLPLSCVDCHQDESYQSLPHQNVNVDTYREYTIASEQVCAGCHEDIFELKQNSVHAEALAEGNADAAVCTDCHDHHAIQDPDMPRARISWTCAQCHAGIYEVYAESVHGDALLHESNPDVPVCDDCHNAHSIEHPVTTQFRLQSPEMCGSCHADEEIMAKYGISTNVFDSYVADFHGTTVQLFEKQTPDHETNKAVCYDCHGIHNILPTSDEHSQVIRENLLTTCQKCHPDATASFPDSWTSHYTPDPEHYPLVYFVDLFYQILIPTVLGGFVLFIGTDVFRRLWDRLARRKEPGK